MYVIFNPFVELNNKTYVFLMKIKGFITPKTIMN